MTEEGLIEPDPGLRAGTRWRNGALTALFLSILAGTAVIDRVWPAPQITLFGQELVEAQKARRERDVFSGTAARWLEKEVELRSRVRRTVAPWWTAILLQAAGVGSADVVVGPEGWLFLRARVRPPQVPYRVLVTPGVNALAAASRRIASHGTDLVVMPVPRKAVVCRELLPKGVDPIPELDRFVLDALQERGVEIVDLLAGWAEVPARELYLSHDSHWALVGQIAAARACIAARPEIQGDEFEAEIEIKARPRAIAENLQFLGIYRDHPAYEFALPEPDDYAVLKPYALNEHFRTYRSLSEIVLCGTSFSAHFNFPLLLYGLARRDLLNASYPGASFGEPIARTMLALARSPKPKTLLYEFPMNQIWDLHQSGGGAPLGMGTLFLVTPPLTTWPLPGKVDEQFWLPQPNEHHIRAAFVEGGVLSTGDGVVMARFAATGAAGSRWRYRSGGLGFDFDWPKDITELTLPIVERAAVNGLFQLIALDEAAKTLRLECSLVTDLDVARSVVATAAATDGALTRYGFEGDLELGVGAGVLVQLAGDRAHRHRATVTATNAAGAQRAWSFDARGGTQLVINLGALAAAPIRAVSVECALPVAEVAVAPAGWTQ